MKKKFNGILLLIMILSSEISSFQNTIQKLNKLQSKTILKENSGEIKSSSLISSKSEKKLRFKSKVKRTKFEPITTAILLAVSLALTIINIVVEFLLDKFLIQKGLDEWKRILADTFLAQRILKEEFCHEIRYLNSIMFHIYNVNELRTFFEFYSIYHRIKSLNIPIPIQLPSYAFLLQIIDNSKRFMSNSEEYFCQNSYDFFGEQAYISNRLNALSNTQDKPSLGGPIWSMLVATVKKSFLFLIDDSLWDKYLNEVNTTRVPFIAAMDWYKDVKQEAFIQEIPIKDFPCKPSDQLRAFSTVCITKPERTCSKIIMNESIDKFFGAFNKFMNNFHLISNYNEVLQKFSELREFLNIAFNLFHNILTVSKTFSKTYNLPEVEINSVEKWNSIKSSSYSLARLTFKYVQDVIAGTSSSSMKKKLKELKSNCKNLISKGVMSIFKPIEKLQIKKYFWRVYNGIKQSIKEFFTFSNLALVAAKQIATQLLELVLSCLLVGLIINIVTGVIKIAVTIASKIKKYLGDEKDKKAEIEFLKKSLIPNVELHIQYTKCNIYAYFYNFMDQQLISLKLVTPKSINYIELFDQPDEKDQGGIQHHVIITTKINEQQNPFFFQNPFTIKSKKIPFQKRFNFKRIKKYGTRELSIDLQNSMYEYLDAKCKQNSVFCRLLLSSSILSYFISNDLVDNLKERIYYYLNAGPISRIMKVEPFNESKKFDEKYLFQNNFSMHTVTFLTADDASKNVGFVYCRSCSDYILVQDSYKELPYNEVINDIGTLDQAKNLDEDYYYRMYFNSDATLDSVSTYLRKATLNKVEVVQVFAFGYKQLQNPNESTDSSASEFQTLESIYIAINSIYKYSPIRAGEHHIQSIAINLVLGDLSDPGDTRNIKYDKFDFYFYEWNEFRCGYAYLYHDVEVLSREEFKAKKFRYAITNVMEYQSGNTSKVRVMSFKKLDQRSPLIKQSAMSQTYDSDFVFIDKFSDGKYIKDEKKSFFTKTVEYGSQFDSALMDNDCDIKISEDSLSEDMSKQVKCVNDSIQNMLQTKICLGCIFEAKNFPKYEMFFDKAFEHFISFVDFNWTTTFGSKVGDFFKGTTASNASNFMKQTIDSLYINSEIVSAYSTNYQKGKLYTVNSRQIPYFDRFKKSFLNLSQYNKSEFANDNFMFVFQKVKPEDKKDKLLKGKYFFNIDEMKNNNLFTSSYRILMPLRLLGSDSIISYRLSNYLGQGQGQAMALDNCIYEVIEKIPNNESKNPIDEKITQSDISLTGEFSEKQEKDFINMAEGKISNARGMTNFNYKSFAKVPIKTIIYVEFIQDSNINPMNYRSEFYDAKNTIVDNLIAKGYMPIWPEFSPDDSKFVNQNVKGFEAPNSGNYFMIFWVKKTIQFAYRFWTKFDYNDFSRQTESICSSFSVGTLIRKDGYKGDYMAKRKSILIERTRRITHSIDE